MTRRKRAAIGAGLVIAVCLLPAGPAYASCMKAPPMPEAIDAAHAVFVGTVDEVTNSARWASVTVTAVWKGDVAARVEVRGGPKDPAGPGTVATTVDRSYSEGQTYLFVVFDGDGELFQDNICSRTTVYRPALERFNDDPLPAASSTSASSTPAPAPTPAPASDGSTPGVVAIVAAVAVAAAGLWLVLSRRERSR